MATDEEFQRLMKTDELHKLEAAYKDTTKKLRLAQRRAVVARRAAVDADADVLELQLQLSNIDWQANVARGRQ